MPTLSEYSDKKSIKMLSIGQSGKGKTGALASLVEMGFKLRILDYDNGVSILVSILKNMIKEGKCPASYLDNVTYETCQDSFKLVGNSIVPSGQPKAFSKGLGLLTHWKPSGGVDLGPVSSWGKDTVLCIDSLSHLSNAALVHVVDMNNRSGKAIWQSDWGQAMEMVEGVLKILYSDAIKCHVIVNAHITHVGEKLNDEGKIIKQGEPHPNTLGQKLPPKVAQYFNTMLHFDTSGSGAAMKRIIRTKPVSELSVKSEILGLPAELPLESGLATFFKAAGQLPNKEG